MLARSILITGCSRGIGLEMVRQLVNSTNPPNILIATCRNPEKATELQDLAKKFPMLKVIQFDVTDYSSLSRIVDDVRAAVGDKGLNLLINNAGVLEKCPGQVFGVPLQDLEVNVFKDVLEANTTAPLFLIKALLPLLREAANVGGQMSVSRAAVVNMSSILASIGGFTGNPDIYGYRASKAALNMITKALAMDFGKEGIFFVALHPGWVQTDMGTSAGMISAEESVGSMFQVLPTLTERHNGLLVSYTGDILPW
ncbi:C-signal-like [Palaemon carinicauda]|uniref:C-signal-like n=1 Tax=Palaemon carinicauda TaxID=392227 RepID=UPI0035B654EB